MNASRASLVVLTLLTMLGGIIRGGQSPSPKALEFFETKVRPIFAFNCLHCHGPDKQKSQLRLDHLSFMLAGGDRGPAIVPGNPKASRLIKAVRYHGSLKMPPTGKLPEDSIAILTRWVAAGAVWPEEPAPRQSAPKPSFDPQERMDFWSFQPITPTPPPNVSGKTWPLDPLDNYILAKLEEAGIRPAAPANKRTLIRRLSFDLVGLPPSPRAVKRFLADDSPEAYTRLVDRLLASPHFGERWGRHWLDLVRFGETYGHEFDYPIPYAWRYRDYVVRAMNADVPYDDFVREHVAGDLLTNPRVDPTTGINQSIIATGFWHVHADKHAPVDVRRAEALRYENQIDVFGKTFLGLTIGCARCHDHKFDPITSADYYALAGFLRSSRRDIAALDPHGKISEITRQIKEVTTTAAQQRRAAIQSSLETIATDLQALMGESVSVSTNTERSQRLARWRTLLDEAAGMGHPLYPLAQLMANPNAGSAVADQLHKAQEASKAFQAETVLFEDFSHIDDWIAAGWAFDHQKVTGRVPVGPPEVSGSIDSRRLALPLVGTLRSDDFTIEHKAVWVRVAGENARIRLVVDGYQMDVFSTLLFSGLTRTINTKGKWQWLRIEGDLGDYLGHRGYLELLDQGDGWLAVDEIRFTDSSQAPPPAPAAIAASLDATDFASRKTLVAAYCRTLKTGAPELAALLRRHYLLATGPHLADARRLTNKAQALAKTLPEPVRVLAMQDGFGCNEELFVRGSHETTKGPVSRRFLVALAGQDQPVIKQGSGRLQLANRLLAPDNPLPARVMVNRVWHYLFGRGIVPSVDNFGAMGKKPTHPELLDRLASDFRRHGWSLKRLIRRIVLSRTYRMSSRPHPATRQRARHVDPTNELLSSQRLRRLEGEAIRDAILKLSGELNESVGGKSISVHLTAFSDGRGRPAVSGPLDGDGRRSIYLRVQRNFLTPLLTAFDFPVPATPIGRRNVSNVPAQALILLNDPFVIQQSRKWAARLLADKGFSPQSRIRRLYLTAYARQPTDEEVNLALHYLRAVGGEDWHTDREAWADYCHVLINTKEFIFLR